MIRGIGFLYGEVYISHKTDNYVCTISYRDNCWKMNVVLTCISISSDIGPFISTISLSGSGCM